MELDEFTATEQLDLDSDHDLIPDWWETMYGGSSVAQAFLPVNKGAYGSQPVNQTSAGKNAYTTLSTVRNAYPTLSPDKEAYATMNTNMSACANFMDPSIPDGDCDFDGDGLTNYQEYRANTNPLSANSRVAITRLERFEHQIEVYWQAVKYVRYEVLRREDLSSPWQSLATNIVPIDDGEYRFIDTSIIPDRQYFYQVRVLSHSRSIASSSDQVETQSVSFHRWQMPGSEEEKQTFVVGPPLIGISCGVGAVSNVDAELGILSANSACFAELIGIDSSLSLFPSVQSFILIKDGAAAGSWFAIDLAIAETQVLLDLTPGHYAGDLANIQLGDRFSLHPLTTLNDLFGDSGIVLTSGAVDSLADKVFIFAQGKFKAYWLSDGSIFPSGWIGDHDGEMVSENPVVYPGSALVVQRVAGSIDASPVYIGEVIDGSLSRSLTLAIHFSRWDTMKSNRKCG